MQTSRLPIERPANLELLLLCGAFLSMYVPTYIALNRDIWSLVGQGHGPVMLALTLWLTWQRIPVLKDGLRAPLLAEQLVAILGIATGLFMYVVGRSQSHFGLDAGSQTLILASLLLLFGGWPALKIMWFPLAFSLTLVPLPGSFVGALTAPLKTAVSYCAEYILHWADYPIGRSGVTLAIGQYRLMVADACAGLNSVFALEALGIFYMSVANHQNRIRNIVLATLILPISFISNVLRVITLVLVTYYFGVDVGQGFVHDFAGYFLFTVSIALTTLLDTMLGLYFTDSRPSKAEATP